MVIFVDDGELTTAEADRMHTALHEAGHAVAAACLRVPFSLVSAVPHRMVPSRGYIHDTPRRVINRLQAKSDMTPKTKRL
jgi:ATP-dependent Zn protease